MEHQDAIKKAKELANQNKHSYMVYSYVDEPNIWYVTPFRATERLEPFIYTMIKPEC